MTEKKIINVILLPLFILCAIKLFDHLQLSSLKVSRNQPPRDWSGLSISPPISVILYKRHAASEEKFENKILFVLLT